MPEELLTCRALNRATLARQLLLSRATVKPVAAIERLGGLQAQLARPPFVALWSRLAGFKREDLVRAVDRRDVVRATLMRGTIHLVSRGDMMAFRPAIQSVLSAGMASILGDRANKLDVSRLVHAARAYFDEEPRTFAELRRHLSEQFPGLDERAMGYMVRMHLPLVQTPVAGERWAYPGQADFAVAESWLGAPFSDDAGGQTLALRYFAAFGPASAQDFQSWSGLATGRALVDELRSKLRVFRDERGRELFDLPKAPRPDEGEEAPVRFLPEFDNVLLGYADRRRIIADEHKPAIATRNLMVPATFSVDGFLAGTWRVERTSKKASLLLKPFARLAKPARTALTAEGTALVQFVEPDSHNVDIQIA